MPMRRKVLMMRQAISPRFATRTLRNIAVPDQDLQRRWVIGIAGIVELRAIRNEEDDIHGRTQLYVFSGPAEAIGEPQSTVRGYGHVHEKIDVMSEIPLAKLKMIVFCQ